MSLSSVSYLLAGEEWRSEWVSMSCESKKSGPVIHRGEGRDAGRRGKGTELA